MQEQTLPRVEPGHESALLKLPKQEYGDHVKDAVETSDYPKHVEHPYGGTVIAKDAAQEASILKSFAALPPKEPDPVFEFGEECATLLGRELTADEQAFCNAVETAAAKQYEAGNRAFAPLEPEAEPDEVIQVPKLVETAIDNAAAAGIRLVANGNVSTMAPAAEVPPVETATE